MSTASKPNWNEVDFTSDNVMSEYVNWLRSEYGDVAADFPPASVVCFVDDENIEYAVVGYSKMGGVSTVRLMDLADMVTTPYEDYIKKSRVVCPPDLKRLKYVYNKNGDEFARKFRQ